MSSRRTPSRCPGPHDIAATIERTAGSAETRTHDSAFSLPMVQRGGVRVPCFAVCCTLLISACGVSACGNTAPRPLPTGLSSSLPTGLPTEEPSASPTPQCTALSAIAQWPLARRAAQLIVAPALDGHITALNASITAGVGGILLLGGTPSQLQSQTTTAAAAATAPLLVMADQEGGGVQRLGSLVDSLPWPRDMAATMTAAAVESAATKLATEMRKLGVTMDLAPVLDVDGGAGPSDRNPDGSRSFSADPAVATSYGEAFIRGLEAGGVVPVAKHFPGLGGSGANTDVAPAATQPLSTLSTGGLLPFQFAVASGAPAVMVANASVPGLTSAPASLSSAAITGLLRQQLGFAGLVLTDSLSAGAISAAGYSVATAAVASVEAGGDMVLFGSTLTAAETRLLAPAAVASTVGQIVTALVDAVNSGKLPETRLDDAVAHVLHAKAFDPCAAR
jgi:beta-N-acetylhexosaminidase